jgi:CheY-like chemotaxis protein
VQTYSRDRQPNVLIIEDSRDQQVLIRYALQQSMPGIESVGVYNEEEAIAYLDECINQQRDLPRLVLLDLYLPEAEDGWRLLQRLKSYPSRRSMPVVVLSVSSAEDDVHRSYQLGANSYIAKPLDFEHWLTYFKTLRQYWWETVTLPRQAYEY